MVISDIHDPAIFTVAQTRNQFIAEDPDWGFTSFGEVNKLLHPQAGHGRPTIEDDAADATVFLHVLDDPSEANPSGMNNHSRSSLSILTAPKDPQDEFPLLKGAEFGHALELAEHNASTCANSKLTLLKEQLDAAHRRAQTMTNELENSNNKCFAAELALRDEEMARASRRRTACAHGRNFMSLPRTRAADFEERLRTRNAALEAREAKVRAAEEEMCIYQAAVEEDLKHTLGAMQDAAKMHTERLAMHMFVV
ncbi:hypothetical protein C8R43DRAFT_950241 [Mycena crocata]|nr:hypothetical protein C8R43DRAFT_950241 [Mycena crocata]